MSKTSTVLYLALVLPWVIATATFVIGFYFGKWHALNYDVPRMSVGSPGVAASRAGAGASPAGGRESFGEDSTVGIDDIVFYTDEREYEEPDDGGQRAAYEDAARTVRYAVGSQRPGTLTQLLHLDGGVATYRWDDGTDTGVDTMRLA